MKLYRSFDQEHTNIISKALDSAEAKIFSYYTDLLRKIGSSHKGAINEKRDTLLKKIYLARDFLGKYPDGNYVEIDELSLKTISDSIRSSLECYREEISQIALEYDIENYRKETKEIAQILKTDLLKNAKTDLFKKYCKSSIDTNAILEFFISYSSKDKKLAGKIRDIIKNNNIEVFLAHRDIPLSKEWRTEILNKLKSCSVLLAICTKNYHCSSWGNQEVGIAFEKGKKIIPVFAEGVDKTRFGFLEAKQGHPKEFSEENIEKIIEEILEIVKL